VDYFGIKLLDLNQPQSSDPMSEYSLKEIARCRAGVNSQMGGLVLATDYWVDIDADGRRGDAEDNDGDEDFLKMGKYISSAEEQRDMVFFTIPKISEVVMVDITDIKENLTIFNAFGRLEIKDERGMKAMTMGDMALSAGEQVLYLTDKELDLVKVDVHLSGNYLDKAGSEKRILGRVHTSGASHFGLVIDEDLNMAYVGQFERGIDVVKLANPELKLVYLKDGKYIEVGKIGPSGVKPADKLSYPDEVYVLGLFPGRMAQTLEVDGFKGDNIVSCRMWGLNPVKAKMTPWDSGNTKTYIEDLGLYRQSDDPLDEKYRMFLSEPIRVTIDPAETRGIDYTDRFGQPKTSNLRILSGDYLQVHLAGSFYNEYRQESYIDVNESKEVGDTKPSIRADLIDRRDNFDFKDSADNAVERPNSALNNPPLYNNVMLDTGEFVYGETDLSITGRGFDFVFRRTYRSQVTYSGPIGWGWDHNYNKRLQGNEQWRYYLS